jgi:DnaJ-class molecular chaperone
MEKRTFYVALGIPHDDHLDTRTITIAYRKVVNRYRRELVHVLDEPTQPPLTFAVLRTYSERRHASLFDPEPEPVRGETEVDRFYGGFVPEVVTRTRRARPEGKDLFVELRLTADEARRGGLFAIHIPVMRECPSCAEHAEEEEHLRCRLCNGTHKITEDRQVEITVPPGVKNDQLARVAMEDVGLGQTDLIVHVLVG